jgi:hypothetical protein
VHSRKLLLPAGERVPCCSSWSLLMCLATLHAHAPHRQVILSNLVSRQGKGDRRVRLMHLHELYLDLPAAPWLFIQNCKQSCGPTFDARRCQAYGAAAGIREGTEACRKTEVRGSTGCSYSLLLQSCTCSSLLHACIAGTNHTDFTLCLRVSAALLRPDIV